MILEEVYNLYKIITLKELRKTKYVQFDILDTSLIPHIDSFERVILQSLEQGTLQNLLFSNPQKLTHSFFRGFVGGFLKLPPVKRSLIGDRYRSRFLSFMRNAG